MINVKNINIIIILKNNIDIKKLLILDINIIIIIKIINIRYKN